MLFLHFFRLKSERKVSRPVTFFRLSSIFLELMARPSASLIIGQGTISTGSVIMNNFFIMANCWKSSGKISPIVSQYLTTVLLPGQRRWNDRPVLPFISRSVPKSNCRVSGSGYTFFTSIKRCHIRCLSITCPFEACGELIKVTLSLNWLDLQIY